MTVRTGTAGSSWRALVRNKDTVVVKGILDSKELPYFFMPPEWDR